MLYTINKRSTEQMFMVRKDWLKMKNSMEKFSNVLNTNDSISVEIPLDRSELHLLPDKLVRRITKAAYKICYENRKENYDELLFMAKVYFDKDGLLEDDLGMSDIEITIVGRDGYLGHVYGLFNDLTEQEYIGFMRAVLVQMKKCLSALAK